MNNEARGGKLRQGQVAGNECANDLWVHLSPGARDGELEEVIIAVNFSCCNRCIQGQEKEEKKKRKHSISVSR